jgi:hypothetical protein
VKYPFLNSCSFLESKPIIQAELVVFEEMKDIALQNISFSDLKQIYLYSGSAKGLSSLNQNQNLKLFYLNGCTFSRKSNQDIEYFDCCQIENITFTNGSLKYVKNYSHIRIARLLHISDSNRISAFSRLRVLDLRSCTCVNLPIFNELTSLKLRKCGEIVNLKTSNFPSLKQLHVDGCLKLATIIVDGPLVAEVELLGELLDLEVINI